MAADERTREAEESSADILGAIAGRTGARRGRAPAKAVPPIVPAAPMSTPIRTSTAARTSTPSKTVQRSFYVDPVEWRAVQLAALNEGVTASEIVRRAIRAALDVGDPR